MGVNSFAKQRQIIGEKVILVPYQPHHVPKYHEWMTSPQLQYLTASEPLSLEEEFEMQKKWVMDADKVTFIVLDRAVYERTECEVDAMIGDTNCYFNDSEDVTTCEIELMIADEASRGRGYGTETLLLMMRFAMDVIGVEKFEAKIKFDNESSTKLFTKFGFREVSKSEVFRETTFLFERDNKYECEKILTQSNHIRYKLLS